MSQDGQILSETKGIHMEAEHQSRAEAYYQRQVKVQHSRRVEIGRPNLVLTDRNLGTTCL